MQIQKVLCDKKTIVRVTSDKLQTLRTSPSKLTQF